MTRNRATLAHKWRLEVPKTKTPKKPRKPYVAALALALVAILSLSAVLAVEAPKKGDAILTAGWSVVGAGDLADSRVNGPAAGIEGMVTDHLSLGVSYAETDNGVADKTYTVKLAPHWHNFYFPVGLVGVNLESRNTPVWGGTAGIGADFWNSDHFGLGVSGQYHYLDRTELKQSFYDVRGSLRFKF